VTRPRLVGINHVALSVDDIGRAVEFYGGLFELRFRGRGANAAFVDIGDQFVALMTPRAGAEAEPHFGLVVDDKEATRAALRDAGVDVLPGRGLDFRDPFGNRVQVVQYDQVQFTKTDRILAGMGLALGKSEQALGELRAKGLA
jgi:catechol 2,3-dioxygenase-like lactoylglutathione lyase family enzyme